MVRSSMCRRQKEKPRIHGSSSEEGRILLRRWCVAIGPSVGLSNKRYWVGSRMPRADDSWGSRHLLQQRLLDWICDDDGRFPQRNFQRAARVREDLDADPSDQSINRASSRKTILPMNCRSCRRAATEQATYTFVPAYGDGAFKQQTQNYGGDSSASDDEIRRYHHLSSKVEKSRFDDSNLTKVRCIPARLCRGCVRTRC